MTTVGLLEGSTEALYDNEAELRRLIGERLVLLGAAAEPGQSEALADIILGRIAREAGRLVKAAEPEAADSAKTPQHKPVVIVGGAGGMGRQLHRAFERSGWPVRILEQGDWPQAAEILKGAGTVVVSVPIDKTISVIEALTGLLPREALLCDVTSVKAGPVAGLHPMFGPDVASFAGQVFVYAPGRDAAAAEPLLEQIRRWGAKVVTCSAEEHDRSMGIIQALRHFTTFAYGVFLSKLNPDLSVILQLSSPIYRLELEMVGRLFAQDPRLYADIILANPRNTQLIRGYVESLAPELAMIEARDRDEFIRRFERVRLYFGDLAPAFMKESGRMLNLIQTERAERADVNNMLLRETKKKRPPRMTRGVSIMALRITSKLLPVIVISNTGNSDH